MIVLITYKNPCIFGDNCSYIVNRKGKFINIFEHLDKDEDNKTKVYTFYFYEILRFIVEGKEILL